MSLLRSALLKSSIRLVLRDAGWGRRHASLEVHHQDGVVSLDGPRADRGALWLGTDLAAGRDQLFSGPQVESFVGGGVRIEPFPVTKDRFGYRIEAGERTAAWLPHGPPVPEWAEGVDLLFCGAPTAEHGQRLLKQLERERHVGGLVVVNPSAGLRRMAALGAFPDGLVGTDGTVYLARDPSFVRPSIGWGGRQGIPSPTLKHGTKGRPSYPKYHGGGGGAYEGDYYGKGEAWADPTQEVPPAAGTVEVPEGHVRAYHYTQEEGQLDSILEKGLTVGTAQGESYGEPNAVWLSTRKPDESIKEFVEVHLPVSTVEKAAVGGPWQGLEGEEGIREWESGAHDFALGHDVPTSQIATHHRPWFHTYRALVEDYGDDPDRSQFDRLLDTPDAPAVVKWKLDAGVTKAVGKHSKDEVDYRPAPSDDVRCDVCVYWRDGACTEVEGDIDPAWTCDEFEAPPPEARYVWMPGAVDVGVAKHGTKGRPSYPKYHGGGGGGDISDAEYEGMARATVKALGPRGGRARNLMSTYTSGRGETINRGLRSGDPEMERNQRPLVEAFDRGPALERDTVLYRGIQGDPEVVLGGGKAGDEFTDRGFVSTSADAGIAADQFAGGDPQFGTLVKIVVPKGTRVLTGYTDEREVLLKPGSKFRVAETRPDVSEVTLEHLGTVEKAAPGPLEKVIRRKGSKWCVESEAGRSFGCYDTKHEAHRRLAQVEAFSKENPKAPQTCLYCSESASKSFLWAEGMAYIPACEGHEERALGRIREQYGEGPDAVYDLKRGAMTSGDFGGEGQAPLSVEHGDGGVRRMLRPKDWSLQYVLRHRLKGMKKDAGDEYAKQGSAMVSFYLPMETARALAVPGGEKPENLHLTLAFLGRVGEDFGEDRVKELRRATRRVARRLEPFSVDLNGVGRFAAGGEQEAVWAHADAPELPEARLAVVRSLENSGFEVKGEHGFTPHITLAYVRPEEKAPLERLEAGKVGLEKVTLTVGGDRWSYRLGTGQEEAMEGEEIASSVIPAKVKGRPTEDEAPVGFAKALTEARYTLGPVYVPGMLDAHGEWTDAEELERAIWDYVRKGDRRIRLQHSERVAGEWVGILAWPEPHEMEMYLPVGGKLQKRNVEFPAGTPWMGVIWQPWAWDLVKAGKLRGFSIGGKSRRAKMRLRSSRPRKLLAMFEEAA